MAVIIKNMEMPKACDSCRFLDDSGDYNVCRATSESVGYNFPVREKRMPHCPLKEAKEPKPYESRAKLPCPKCGSKRLSIWCSLDKDGNPIEAIACDKCRTASAWSHTTIGAIRDWNKRAREWKE